MKKVVLITSGQPSINPRLVKEADALANAGYEVTVIYSFWTHWANEKDKSLLASKKWKAYLVGGNPFDGKMAYFITRVMFKIFQLASKKLGLRFHLAELSKSRGYLPLLFKTKSIKADLYIAHNLAALPVAIDAAHKNKAKCGFDAEDFHRQEVSDDVFSSNYLISKFLEDKYFPRINYLTAASPLIAQEYQKLYPNQKPIVINNVFPSNLQPKDLVSNHSDKQEKGLRLFWFSQTVGTRRGIEDTIVAIGKTKHKDISLTVLGNANAEIKNFFSEMATKNGLNDKQLVFLPPADSEKVFEIVAGFDIGLALESGFCRNNAIALSNKLFTYLISGIAVIASETDAQKLFMQTYPSVGKSYPIGETDKFAEILNYFYHHPSELQMAKQNAFYMGKTELNWEKESEKFLEIIKNL